MAEGKVRRRVGSALLKFRRRDRKSVNAYNGGLYSFTEKVTAMTTTNSNEKKITAQIPEDVHSLLRKGMAITGMTVSQFVAQAIREKAEQVIKAEAPIVLSREACLQLLELMENPPPKNERYLEAEARYERTVTYDGPTP